MHPMWLDPTRHPDAPAVRDWQAHPDTGRLGAHPPLAPAILAGLMATDALLRTVPSQGQGSTRA